MNFSPVNRETVMMENICIGKPEVHQQKKSIQEVNGSCEEFHESELAFCEFQFSFFSSEQRTVESRSFRVWLLKRQVVSSGFEIHEAP